MHPFTPHPGGSPPVRADADCVGISAPTQTLPPANPTPDDGSQVAGVIANPQTVPKAHHPPDPVAALRADEERHAAAVYRADRAGDCAAALFHRKARWDAMTARHRLTTPAAGDLSAKLILFSDVCVEYEDAAHAARAHGRMEAADIYERIADDLRAEVHVLKEREADRVVKAIRYAVELFPVPLAAALGQLLHDAYAAAFAELSKEVAELRGAIAELVERLGVTP